MTGRESSIIPEKRLKSGFALPVYGLGTWGMGGSFRADSSDDERCVSAIRRCIELGIRHIDTAEMYGAGHAEELVGRAIVGVQREQLIIASKALAHHLRAKDLVRAAEKSIERLGCGYLDIYMIHHPSDEIPIQDTMCGMAELVRRGLIRQVGVANFTKERLEDAQRHSEHQIVVNQVHYSLAVREPESSGLLDYCQEHDVLVAAWQPIDRGLYSARCTPTLRTVSERQNLTPVQAALSWLTSQRNVVAIAKTTTEDHLVENIAGARSFMEEEDVELLREQFEEQRGRSEVYALR